ncbi:MAG TPA: MBL fold metallo-hydrolase [Vicinamibacterales bacterium]|nr:MBL fold metallo-hydrolase [Vicinamibacterales bacterium]
MSSTEPTAAQRPLAIYFVDVEGGQSTLIVTPAGESLLIDAGFPGDGTFQSKPGDPAKARDAQRILAAARDAGVSRIDSLLVTHFHGDHDGGIVELAQLIPIRTFVDHDTVPLEAEAVAGTLDLFRRYAAVRAKARHIVPKPGDRLPLTDVDVTVVSSGGQVVATPLPGAGSRNAACGAAPAVQEKIENPRSTGVLIQFGRFRFLDLGDLVGAPLRSLVCPADRIGPVDVYLITHHGNADAADPATFAALRPRAAVMNNGPQKGGGAETFATLHDIKNMDVWQLHRSTNPGARNFADEQIANLVETTANWIRVTANEDGSFVVMNQRTGKTRSYSR